MADLPAKDSRRMITRLNEENFPNIINLVEQLKIIGDKYGATPGQIALAWLLAQGDDVIPIPGNKKLKVFRSHSVKAMRLLNFPNSIWMRTWPLQS